MQSNKKEKIFEELLTLLASLDKKEFLSKINKEDKKEIFQFLEKELFTLNEIKELILSINFKKSEILIFLYDIIKLYFDKESKVYNKTKNLYKLASKNSFNWPDNNTCFNKLGEEVSELKMALLKKDKNNIKEEIGDILFTLNSFAHLSKVDITECLELANNKFEKRFNKLIEYAKLQNIDLGSVSSDIKEKLWKEAKKNLKSS